MSEVAHQPPRMLRRGEHLRRRKSSLRVGGDDRHALVVRRERGAHVDAEHGELHAEERERHAERQEAEDDGEVDARSAATMQADLEPAALRPCRGRTACWTPWTCRFRPSSVSSGKNSQPWRRVISAHAGRAAFAASSSTERDRVDVDVGVLADRVRVGVVAGVLGHPPRVADADEAGRRGRGRAGRWRGPDVEDLAVRGLVAEERELGEDDAERAGDEQLEPGVAEQDEPGDGAAEGRDEQGEHHVRTRCGAAARGRARCAAARSTRLSGSFPSRRGGSW